MDTLVAKLAPPSRRVNVEEEIQEYGNLDSRGAIAGMQVPAVPDVSRNASQYQ